MPSTTRVGPAIIIGGTTAIICGTASSWMVRPIIMTGRPTMASTAWAFGSHPADASGTMR
ncbi:hypothetical protein [Brevundimonas sp.]|uniref:hypothetical protein n=1 Tax=Brevundimonas sp. TaxID=1871086 RepID=UPI00351553B3